tara:strand:+ start:445 stop:867 length:423 start_codon:yes stop_codon:yes gene_type:complete
MIKYKLKCESCKKSFDSWFSSSSEYEKLKKKKYLNCHFCNSNEIIKTVMAPNILNYNDKKEKKIRKKNDIRKRILEFQNFIKKNFKNVGKDFAYEARSLHYSNEKKSKGIYGSATKKQINELQEEGIETHVFPWIDNKNN